MSRAIRAPREQQFLLPPSMDDWLPTSHPARFVADLVDELDLDVLGFRMSPGEEGRPHFAPELLHRKQLEKRLKELDAATDAGMAAVEADEQEPEPDWKMPEAMQSAEERKKRIRETLAQLDAAEVDHLHPQEPEARVMKTREGLRLGYNAQIVVDHDSDLIVAAEVVTDATDHLQLVSMVEEASATTGKGAEQTVADAGYASGEQFAEAERRHLPVIVAVQEESSAKAVGARLPRRQHAKAAARPSRGTAERPRIPVTRTTPREALT